VALGAPRRAQDASLGGGLAPGQELVRAFLDQFAQGSPDLLRYVGLLGKGKLATVINTS
jgi:hypothetical protein